MCMVLYVHVFYTTWTSQAWRYLWLRLQDQDSHGREVRKKTSNASYFWAYAPEVPPTGSANQFTIEFGYNEVRCKFCYPFIWFRY